MKVRQVFYNQVLGLLVVTKQKSGYNACTILHFGKNAIHCSKEGFIFVIYSIISSNQKHSKKLQVYIYEGIQDFSILRKITHIKYSVRNLKQED